MLRGKMVAVGLIILLTLPIANAATTATTIFVFNVPTTRGFTVTYGGLCHAGAFFFNERDALFDPDTDGNGSKVKPRPQRRSDAPRITDYNFVGTDNPSDRNVAYGNSTSTANPPATNNDPLIEFVTAQYLGLAAPNDALYAISDTSVSTDRPTQRFVIKTNVAKNLVKDINFFYMGQSVLSTSDCTLPDGLDGDLNAYIWNWEDGVYDRIANYVGTLADTSGVITPRTLNAIIDSNVARYVNDDTNIIFLVKARRSTASKCIYSDYLNVKINEYNATASTDFCQSETLAAMTVTNAGNVDINVDANFSNAFTGADFNAVLKVWQGSSGCGADGNGLGGWQMTCTYASPTDVNTAPNTTNCRQYEKAHAAQYGRLITQLTVGSATQLCFSGDFNGFVPAGDHNNMFNQCVGSECASDVTDSMLGWWTFNDGSGTNLNDNTIYNNDGTLTNTPTWMSGTSCAAGGCLDFNGQQTEYVGFPAGIDFNFGNYDATTITFWLKDSAPEIFPQFVMGIGGDSDARPFDVKITSAGTLNIGLQPDAGYWTRGFWDTNANLDTEWHHYALTYNTNDFDANLYVDGVNTYAFGLGAVSGTLQVSGTAALFFGVSDDGSGNPDIKYLNGRLDDIRVYSRKLTPNEVRAVMSHPQ